MATVTVINRLNRARLRAIIVSPTGPVARDLLRRGVRVQSQAKRNLGGGRSGPRRIDTGRLRASITVELAAYRGLPAVRVGTNVKYACILGAHTRVVTDQGPRSIGQIRPGDLVLTQSGEFRPVLACNRFPVTEKPDLVDIEVPWRTGSKPHRLTVTADHKILVRRGPRLKWVKATELRMNDELFLRLKTAHNRGSAAPKTCDHCGKQYKKAMGQGQGRRFCTSLCRDAYWRVQGHWMQGRDRGAEFSMRQSAVKKKLYAEHPEKHPNRSNPGVTDHEVTLATWLTLRGLSFEHRKHVNGIWPDFYVPSEHRVYEADGAYWHRDQAKDIERDARLQAALPGVEIVHMHFYDRRHSPELNINPLPQVWYVPVNPSPESFVEPTEFTGVKPTLIRRYKWKYTGKPRGRVPMLYDLTVDGEHSFMANGILVSNSYVHNGTGLYGPRRALIYPRRAKVLRWRRNGGYVYARYTRGMRPNTFLTSALAAAHAGTR